MDSNMKSYYDYTLSPLGRLFYATLHRQLEWIKGKTVLDFGSGFGFTADRLAVDNKLTALEPDIEMIANSQNQNGYIQLIGDVQELKKLESESFDVVLCHLVLEFVEFRDEILAELTRLLKPGGTLSIVRHNREGRIIQAAVCEVNFSEAKRLLSGEDSFSETFGDIKYYDNDELLSMLNGRFEIEKVQGIRALASLHDAVTQNSEGWLEDMLHLENELLKRSEFVAVSYFNHIIMIKR